MRRRETSSAKKWGTQHALKQVSLHGTKNRKVVREGYDKRSLFAPVYMTEYVPLILQTVNDNMILTTTRSITEHVT